MADPTPPPHPPGGGPGQNPIPPPPGSPGQPIPAIEHPKRGTSGAGKDANMVADGVGNWQTVATQRREQ